MLVHRDPLDLFNTLSNLLESSTQRLSEQDNSKVESSRWIPAVDIKEEPNQFILYVDLPGVNSDNIEISMENNVLTVKGTREEMQKEEKNSYHRIERVRGVFYRRFTLPDTADAEQIHAKSKQGVLEIKIGKKEMAQARRIEVQKENEDNK